MNYKKILNAVVNSVTDFLKGHELEATYTENGTVFHLSETNKNEVSDEYISVGVSMLYHENIFGSAYISCLLVRKDILNDPDQTPISLKMFEHHADKIESTWSCDDAIFHSIYIAKERGVPPEVIAIAIQIPPTKYNQICHIMNESDASYALLKKYAWGSCPVKMTNLDSGLSKSINKAVQKSLLNLIVLINSDTIEKMRHNENTTSIPEFIRCEDESYADIIEWFVGRLYDAEILSIGLTVKEYLNMDYIPDLNYIDSDKMSSIDRILGGKKYSKKLFESEILKTVCKLDLL